MEKEYSIQGTYQSSYGEEKEFDFKYDNLPENEKNNTKLIELLDHPWKLIKEGSKLGINGVKRFFTVLFLFTLSNSILFVYSIIRLIKTDFEYSKIIFVLLVLLIGVGITIYSAYRTYQYVVIDTLSVIYKNLESLFKKITEMIIDQVEKLIKGKVNLTDTQLTKAIDFGKMINSNYKKMPRFLRKGIILILNRLPIVGMVSNLKTDIISGNKLEASTKLYNKIDGFISESIFGSNNTKWIWWLLPLNIIISLILIKSQIG